MTLRELRYVYRVEGAGKAFETMSLSRAYYYLGQLSEKTETAVLTALILDTTTQFFTGQATLAHSLDGSLEENQSPTFTPQ